MDYNNILNNKRKFNEFKNKTSGFVNKATDKIAKATNTAVDSVVDTVKNINTQQSKVGIFEDVIGVIDSELINITMDNPGACLGINEYGIKQNGLISIEEILEAITSDYSDELKKSINTSDYIEALFTLVSVHYKYEKALMYKFDKRTITLSIIPEDKNGEDASEVVPEEHVCNCEPVCENCTCKQQVMTLEFMDDSK